MATIANTIQQVYTAICNSQVTTTVFNGVTTVYDIVLSNQPDSGITESYARVTVLAGAAPRSFDYDQVDLDITISIYDQTDERSGTVVVGEQSAQIFADQVTQQLRDTIPLTVVGLGELLPVGYTDTNSHYQTDYRLKISLI